MSDEQEELVREFIIECTDQMDSVDNELLELENDPTNAELLGKVFRAFHNMKGASGFFGFHKLESLTHVGENLLSKLRDGEIILNAGIISALMAMGDAVRNIFADIEEGGTDGDDTYDELKKRIAGEMNKALGTDDQPSAKEAVEAPPPVVKDENKDPLDLELEAALEMAKERRKKEVAEYKKENTKATEAPMPVVKDEDKDPLDLEIEAALAMAKERRKKELQELKLKKEKAAAAEKKSPDKKKKSSEKQKSISDSSIRVDVDVLDYLMNLVGELVLTRNQIAQNYVPVEGADITKSIQVLNRITSELQEEVMKTRMQPINNLFSKFPRIVRGLADSINKKIRLEIIGKETELDRTLIESLRDPLTHMVRNSVDHGIELPTARQAKGKEEEGVVILKAYHESGHVHIDIMDDGAGINSEIIKKKALEKQLRTQEELDAMSEKEIVNMIFLPGFSTAEKITNISGRGVGMDVVRTNIEKVGGVVEINTVLGKGSTFNIKVPLTLAIMPALIVRVGDGRLAIPQVNIKELQMIDKEQMDKLEVLHGTPVLNLREEFIPLLSLNEQLGLEEVPSGKGEDDSTNVVVLQVDDQLIGLVVDDIFDSQEIVVKPLGPQLEGLSVYAGATILGDGQIALIIDTLGLAKKAKALSGIDKRLQSKKSKDDSDDVRKNTQLLICKTVSNGHMGIPLDDVVRLESLKRDLFEFVGGKELVKYRDNILQVYRVQNILIDRRKKEREVDSVDESSDETAKTSEIRVSEDVIVLEVNHMEVGFVVGDIMDTTNVYLNEMGPSTRAGVSGTLILGENVIEVLDVTSILKTADPHLFSMNVG